GSSNLLDSMNSVSDLSGWVDRLVLDHRREGVRVEKKIFLNDGWNYYKGVRGEGEWSDALWVRVIKGVYGEDGGVDGEGLGSVRGRGAWGNIIKEKVSGEMVHGYGFKIVGVTLEGGPKVN
nr:hypothetical protein [Tanacetum cinerariifolium]